MNSTAMVAVAAQMKTSRFQSGEIIGPKIPNKTRPIHGLINKAPNNAGRVYPAQRQVAHRSREQNERQNYEESVEYVIDSVPGQGPELEHGREQMVRIVEADAPVADLPDQAGSDNRGNQRMAGTRSCNRPCCRRLTRDSSGLKW